MESVTLLVIITDISQKLTLPLVYTDHAGPEIAVDSAAVLRTVKTEMLVPVKHWRLWEESSFSALL